jgi:hypothetical protein
MSQKQLRRTTRHVLHARGQAVDARHFTLLGERILDASGEGCLLACDAEAKVGQRVFVTFQMPRRGTWFDAEAEVVRVIQGNRYGDPGYCAALRYVAFSRRERLALGVDLRAHPLVPPQRSAIQRLKALAP